MGTLGVEAAAESTEPGAAVVAAGGKERVSTINQHERQSTAYLKFARVAMVLRSLILAAITVAVAANSWPQWPDAPLSRGGVDLHADAAAGMHAKRELSESGAVAPPYDETAIYHIILWSSIITVIAMYFAAMALAGMQVEGDSLLYSKAKAD